MKAYKYNCLRCNSLILDTITPADVDLYCNACTYRESKKMIERMNQPLDCVRYEKKQLNKNQSVLNKINKTIRRLKKLKRERLKLLELDSTQKKKQLLRTITTEILDCENFIRKNNE